MKDILIAIAGRQHADQLSAALIDAGQDAVLHHAVPVRPSLAATLAGRSRLHALPGITFRVANRLLPLPLAGRVAYAMYALFDRQVARVVRRSPPRAVIVYENGALDTLTAARALGVPTILDAASVHHRMQAESGMDDAGSAFRTRINARKDAEIALADHILCCSALAARSYIDAGVPAGRVHVVPLGFDPGAFAPAPAATPNEGRLRIAFVGRFTTVKGADLLAAALETLSVQGMAYECRIAAAMGNADAKMLARLERNATLLGKVPHDELAALYHWADLLVMPSRFDSFGLVVLEALACGLPVLASDHVGAADFIQAGVNGDVIPFDDAAALTRKLAGYAADPGSVRAMRPAAAASAEGAEWPHYRARVAAIVARILDDRAP